MRIKPSSELEALVKGLSAEVGEPFFTECETGLDQMNVWALLQCIVYDAFVFFSGNRTC